MHPLDRIWEALKVTFMRSQQCGNCSDMMLGEKLFYTGKIVDNLLLYFHKYVYENRFMENSSHLITLIISILQISAVK